MNDKLNFANRENGTMNDTICEPSENLAVATVADGLTAVLDRRDDTTVIEVCDYCGFCPCGCGG